MLMPVKDPRFPGAVLVTLILAMVLSLIPLGDVLSLWRPEWIDRADVSALGVNYP